MMQVDVPEIAAKSEADLSMLELDFISSGEQYISFQLDKENYGVDILSVTEIRGWEKPTSVPKTPEYMLGVINMRGVIVPIIDLRVLFGVGDAEYSATTVVMVLSAYETEKKRTMGFVVDAVSDVLNVKDEDLRTSPRMGSSVPISFVHGLVNVGNDVATLLKLDQLLSLDEE